MSEAGGRRGTDAVETEWQFEVADLESLQASVGELARGCGFDVRAAKPRNIRDLYLDTEDWRFYRAGYALRVRRVGNSTEATLKSLAGGEDGPRQRREVSEPIRVPRGRKTDPPDAFVDAVLGGLKVSSGVAGELVRSLAGSRQPRLLFEVRTRRQVFELRPAAPGEEPAQSVVVDAAGGLRTAEGRGQVAEVALDRTEVSLPAGEGTLLMRRLEVEAAEGGVEETARFVEMLRGTPGTLPVGASKFETGLEAAGLTPEAAPDLGPTGTDGSMPASRFALAVLRRYLGEVLAHEPGVRVGEDPEELHDMRVAVRRLRSTLKLYRDHLPGKAARFEEEFDHFGGVLGEVRDLDVQIERLSGEADVPEGIVSALEDRRVLRREQMLAELDSARYEHLVEDMGRTLRGARAPLSSPILEVAPPLVADQHRKVIKRARRVSGASTFEELHDLRKGARRLRYAVEPLVEIYGKPATRMVKQLKGLQDLLGEQQDSVVTADVLEEVAISGELPPEAVFRLGVEAQRRRSEAERMQSEIPKARALRAFQKGDEWKRLEKALASRAPGKAKG